MDALTTKGQKCASINVNNVQITIHSITCIFLIFSILNNNNYLVKFYVIDVCLKH